MFASTLFFQSKNYTIIPQDPMPMLQLQDKDCAIEPGCVYNIEVKSAKTRSNITYTVPGMYFKCIYRSCFLADFERFFRRRKSGLRFDGLVETN